MTLHLRPLPDMPRTKADTRAYREAKARIRAELEHDKAEREISRLQSQGHIPRHFHQSQQFKQTGDRA